MGCEPSTENLKTNYSGRNEATSFKYYGVSHVHCTFVQVVHQRSALVFCPCWSMLQWLQHEGHGRDVWFHGTEILEHASVLIQIFACGACGVYKVQMTRHTSAVVRCRDTFQPIVREKERERERSVRMRVSATGHRAHSHNKWGTASIATTHSSEMAAPPVEFRMITPRTNRVTWALVYVSTPMGLKGGGPMGSRGH